MHSMERIRFIEHKGQRVLLLDFRNCTPEEVTALSSHIRSVVAQEPKESVLALADFTGAQFSREAVNRIKEVTALDRPFVKRAAWVGTENLPKVFYDAIRTFSVRDFPVFNTREEGLEYLTQPDSSRESA
jgi:hypothetical protein